MILAQDVHRSYLLGRKAVEVLRGIDLEIMQGERIFLCGASGAGKTTLLYTLAGLERPQRGRVQIGGEDLYELSRRDQSLLRNSKMGYIFQNYYLLPELTALENVMLPGMIRARNVRKRAIELLVEVGLEERIQHLPAELSGGEQQRVAIARALVNDPAIVFADEPTGNLDSRNGGEVMELLLDFAENLKTTLVVVTHDRSLARLGDRTLEILDGQMVMEEMGSKG
ncbi:MAG: ABC transporter [Roseibacillus sp.]|nr:ABC transporter [Roseibacillus sp.]MBP36281.1 ABC transporter [Roseibacillus sp.]MCP4730130.1 ABC transporter ATP-binding protein [Roseibacillus sp.]